MSATFDTDQFANYFKNFSRVETIPAPIITIKKPGLFTTTIHYLDQLIQYKPKSEFFIDKPEIDSTTYDAFIFLVGAFDLLEKKQIKQEDQVYKKIGSVLVFLPGIYEIEEAYRRLTLKAKE